MSDDRQEKILYNKRAFLNPASEGGMAAADVTVRLVETDTDIRVDATLGLSDCSHSISLDFDVWESSRTAPMLRARRKKLEILKDICQSFFDAVEQAYDEIEDKYRDKQKAATEKQKKKG